MLCLRMEIIFLFSYILQVSYLNKKNKEKHKVGNKCPLSLLESHCGQVERFISVFLCFNKCITHRSGLVSSTHMTLFLVQTLSISWIRESPTVFMLAGSFLSSQKERTMLVDQVEFGLYSLSSAQGWRFCRAYREELWAHSGSDTADSPRDFWRADCCSCMMRRLAC